MSRSSRAGGLEPLAEVLAAYLEGTRLGEVVARADAIDAWAEVVGERVARVTRAVEVQGTDLVVEVRSSAWMAELSMMRNVILEELNAARSGPPVAGLRFRLAGTRETHRR